jgi:hypothetical protein
LRHAQVDSPETSDLVAERWAAALPHDIVPLLHLMQSAEARNALQKAFKLMERAEEIDGLNADVRRARLRLLVAMTARHLRGNKPKLAEKDLRQIEALPQAQQGDRPAFVAALRYVWCNARNAGKDADAAFAEAARFLADDATTQLLFLQVENWCGRQYSALGKPMKPSVPLVAAFGRICALGDDVGMPVEMIEAMLPQLMAELSLPNIAVNPPALAALGESAFRQQYFPLAYTIAGVGLTQGGIKQAQFLFLRTRSLPPWEGKRRQSCLAAATELARRQQDSSLLKRIGEWRAELLEQFEPPEQARADLGAEEIARSVKREIEQREFPTSSPDLTYDDNDCDCPACCAERGELPAELMELMDQLGPEAVARAMAEMLGIGGKKKRRRRHSQDDFDLPF